MFLQGFIPISYISYRILYVIPFLPSRNDFFLQILHPHWVAWSSETWGFKARPSLTMAVPLRYSALVEPWYWIQFFQWRKSKHFQLSPFPCHVSCVMCYCGSSKTWQQTKQKKTKGLESIGLLVKKNHSHRSILASPHGWWVSPACLEGPKTDRWIQDLTTSAPSTCRTPSEKRRRPRLPAYLWIRACFGVWCRQSKNWEHNSNQIKQPSETKSPAAGSRLWSAPRMFGCLP